MKNKVEGHPSLVKDIQTGVIINRENSDRERYRTAKKQAMMNLDTQSEIVRISNELDEIKDLLKQLLVK